MADKKRQKPGFIRLDKFLGQTGHGTRSQIREIAKKGRIQVNGETVQAADFKIQPGRDHVTLDGAAVEYAAMEYYMLNKPQGVVSARTDLRYPTVVELIGDALRRDLFPVGRLDVDTEGLLLITNDGNLAHNLLSPKKHVDKVYRARISGVLPQDAGTRLKEGLLLADGTRTLPGVLSFGTDGEVLKEGGEREVYLTIREGKFHQVKRMFEALGCHVEYLKRLSMGSLVLDEDLKPGEYRPLTAEEIHYLKDGRNQRADSIGSSGRGNDKNEAG